LVKVTQVSDVAYEPLVLLEFLRQKSGQPKALIAEEKL
jgi:hypothetical protein